MNEGASRSFPWFRSADVLGELLETHRLALDEGRSHYDVMDRTTNERLGAFTPPFLQMPLLQDDPHAFQERARDALGRHVVLLVQAGASALGYWDDDECLAHKVIKRYVVRGKGRAQSTHLKTKGKSRYGSRLRLQNWTRQLVETNEKLVDWFEQWGEPEQILVSCPVRTWPELYEVDPQPPFAKDDPRRRKIPLHVHVPDFEELQRVRSRLGRGRLTWLEGDAPTA